jgi:hypothetical protein
MGMGVFAQKTPNPPLPPDPGSVCNAITGNLVGNCGFETGDFTDWTQGGNLVFQEVQDFAAHSGNWGAYLGPVGSDGTLTQTITDSAGTVDLDYWLANDDSGADAFSVQWDGTTIAGSVLNNAGSFGYSLYSFVLTSTGSDTLQFSFEQTPGFWELDDISVVQTPEPAGFLLLGTLVGLVGWRHRTRPKKAS